jgi:hypothetical protein
VYFANLAFIVNMIKDEGFFIIAILIKFIHILIIVIIFLIRGVLQFSFITIKLIVVNPIVNFKISPF